MAANESVTKRIFPVLGMSCASCAARVGRTLGEQPGVRSAAVNYAAATVAVEYDAAATAPERLRQAVRDAGYDLVVDLTDAAGKAESEHDARYRALKRRVAAALALAVPLLVVGMLFMHRTWSPRPSSSGSAAVFSPGHGASCAIVPRTWIHWWP